MKKIIGVMGPGKKQATQKDIDCAFEIGRLGNLFEKIYARAAIIPLISKTLTH